LCLILLEISSNRYRDSCLDIDSNVEILPGLDVHIYRE
jgi:hypothetical protein